MSELTVPTRIQRKRTKGWKMPENTVYVGRPTKWGNQFEIGRYNFVLRRELTAQDCVDRYRAKIENRSMFRFDEFDVVVELEGKDLACWCPFGEPCHADVLLELANRIV